MIEEKTRILKKWLEESIEELNSFEDDNEDEFTRLTTVKAVLEDVIDLLEGRVNEDHEWLGEE